MHVGGCPDCGPLFSAQGLLARLFKALAARFEGLRYGSGFSVSGLMRNEDLGFGVLGEELMV